MSSSSLSASVKGAKPKPAQGRDDASSKGKVVASAELKKKFDGSGKHVTVSSQKSATVVAKLEVKGKTSSSSPKVVSKSTKTTKTSWKGRAEKKVYSLPGQKHDPPEEREPLRIFYESLSKQIPSSEMAEFWLMEHGLQPHERARKTYERKQRRQQQSRTGTPIKPSRPDRPESSKKSQPVNNGDLKVKKRVDYSDDNDFIIKTKKSKA